MNEPEGWADPINAVRIFNKENGTNFKNINEINEDEFWKWYRTRGEKWREYTNMPEYKKKIADKKADDISTGIMVLVVVGLFIYLIFFRR